MDPTLSSPTNSNVVRDTMVRILNIAKEANQNYAIVTYVLQWQKRPIQFKK